MERCGMRLRIDLEIARRDRPPLGVTSRGWLLPAQEESRKAKVESRKRDVDFIDMFSTSYFLISIVAFLIEESSSSRSHSMPETGRLPLLIRSSLNWPSRKLSPCR